MRSTDIEGIGELAGEALAAGGGLIKDMHEGIASRPFEILGPAAAPVRAVHDGIANAVYGGVRSALRAGSRGGAYVLARRATEDGPPLAATPAGSLTLGAACASLRTAGSSRGCWTICSPAGRRRSRSSL